MGGKILQNRSSRLQSANKKITIFQIEEREAIFEVKREKNKNKEGEKK
jgi:hypothetical protein